MMMMATMLHMLMPILTMMLMVSLTAHVFFQQLTGIQHNFDRLSGALEALTDARLAEYVDSVPYEWRSNNDAADRIADYLKQARQNRATLFRVINHLLL